MQIMHLIIKLLVLMTFSCSSLTSLKGADTAIDSLMPNFSLHNKRTYEIFIELAQRIHIPIGISGENLGPNYNQQISIDSNGKSLRQVLDEICSKDRRFSWTQLSDGSISVWIGPHQLSLVNIRVKSLHVDDVSETNLVTLVLQLPEVRRWERATGCGIGHQLIIVGNPPPEVTWKANLQISNKPLWKVLNDLSVSSGSYSWSAVKYAGTPCFINFNPPRGK